MTEAGEDLDKRIYNSLDADKDRYVAGFSERDIAIICTALRISRSKLRAEYQKTALKLEIGLFEMVDAVRKQKEKRDAKD